MTKTRQITAALTALALLGLPASAEGPSSATRNGFTGGDFGTHSLSQESRDASHYDDMMDDVEAVIDAMEGAHDEGVGRYDAAPADAPSQSFVAENNANLRKTMPAGPHSPSPVVVELFTAQGCGGCPPADDLLADLSGQSNILALSWHVDYWDYLGWPDSFARPEFTARQKGYNLARGARSLFTPQFIIGGEVAIARPQPGELMSAIKREMAEGDHLSITRKQDGARVEIELAPRGPLPPVIAVQLVRYLPERSIEVEDGENDGRRLTLRNVVAASDVLATWDGKAPLRLNVTLGAGKAADLPGDTRHALIVQRMRDGRPGEIFAALTLD
ncbi:DUF1223 domain-containing protein [Paracoccus aurantiacus]|nr:DUF1223 domain-containing protein [Paracoccus aurantiacus]